MSFSEINQVRIALKMLFSNYSWFDGIDLIFNEDWSLIVSVSGKPDVKKLIPTKFEKIPVIILNK